MCAVYLNTYTHRNRSVKTKATGLRPNENVSHNLDLHYRDIRTIQFYIHVLASCTTPLINIYRLSHIA
jgi:hypothetical protein